MLIAVLVVIWVVALTPMLFRRYSERQASTSVDRFSYRTWLFRRVYPSMPASRANVPAAETRDRSRDLDATLRQERRRIRLRRERRRRVLVGIGVFLAATLVFGAIPHLHLFWDFSAITAVVAAAYIGVIISAARSEALSLERLRKVVPLAAQAPTHRPAYLALATAAGGGRSQVPISPMPQRPAFVLVEAPQA